MKAWRIEMGDMSAYVLAVTRSKAKAQAAKAWRWYDSELFDYSEDLMRCRALREPSLDGDHITWESVYALGVMITSCESCGRELHGPDRNEVPVGPDPDERVVVWEKDTPFCSEDCRQHWVGRRILNPRAKAHPDEGVCLWRA